MAPASRLEAIKIAALTFAAPPLCYWLSEFYQALRIGPVGVGVEAIVIALVVCLGFAFVGMIAGSVAVRWAGRTRSPLRVGVTAAALVVLGLILGQVVSQSGLHSEAYSFLVDIVGGLIVGLLLIVVTYRVKGDIETDEPLPPPGAGLRAAFKWVIGALVLSVALTEFGLR